MAKGENYGYESVPAFPAMDDDLQRLAARAAEQEAERRRHLLETVVGGLEREAKKRVGNREQLEQRWLEDLYQYHGQLTTAEISALGDAKSNSRIVVNQTRTKTNTMAARLSDLLFPTDDTNWSVEPTPVPRLTKEASELDEKIRQIREQASQAAAQAQQAQAAQQQQGGGAPSAQPQAMPAPGQKTPQQMLDEADMFARRLAAIQDQSAIAKRASDNMTMRIEDQLIDCCYAAEARQVIEDACKIGTGVMKGPVLDQSVGRRWEIDQEGRAMLLPGPRETSIAMRRVDPWHFFPDMTRQTVSPNDGVFERHLLNASDMRKLARGAGFDRKAIADLIKNKGGRASLPTNFETLSRINISTNVFAPGDLYEVWEYHGPMSGDDLRNVAEAQNRIVLLQDAAERWPADVTARSQPMQPQPSDVSAMGEDGQTIQAEFVVEEISFGDFDVDPLAEVQVVVWFCDGKLLKFEISPNERDDLPYSVYCIEPDEACPFGYGVPYMIRNTQAALNGVMRMIMDNGAVAAGPQVIFNPTKIKPANGGDDYSIGPRKVWKFTEDAAKDEIAFQEIRIDSHLNELLPIANLLLKFMDDEAAIPLIAAGEQGSTQTKTMGGMTILMNAANIIFKRAVKRFDDDMTTPNIRRMFDWNMTYSTDPAIKGDSQVNAKGSSVLLVREMVAANLMIIAEKFGAHPVFGPMLKSPSLLRQIFRSLGLMVTDSVYTDEELKRMAENMPAEEGDPVKMAELEIRRMEIEARVQIANMTTDGTLKVAMVNRETEMMKMAQAGNMGLDKIRAMLEDAAAERTHKERMMAGEIGAQEMQARAAAERGAAPRISGNGGGGYV